MSVIAYDKHGFPVLLVDPKGDTSVDPPVNSTANQPPVEDVPSTATDNTGDGENPRSQQGAAPPSNINPVEWARFMDAVRTASREIPSPKPGDIQDLIHQLAKDHTKVDAKEFERSVKEQRLSDLVDILDQQLRKSGSQPRARRMVRLTAPAGFVNQTISSLDARGIAEIQHRLESLGHNQGDVESFFADKHPKHVNDQTQPEISQVKQTLANGG